MHVAADLSRRRPLPTLVRPFALALAALVAAALPSAGAAKRAKAPPPPPLQLVESTPLETALDHPEVADAHDVWVALIDGARERIDVAQFYISNEPGSRLEPVLVALEKAARRGVRVRVLAEKKFYDEHYTESVDRLAARDGIEVRLYDTESTMGGVLHAKLLLIDGRRGFVGSQNFDWRSLTHNVELGVRFDDPTLGLAFGDVFDSDWAWAGGAPAEQRVTPPDEGYGFPVELPYGDTTVAVTPLFSPTGWLPEESLWDLPRLVELIDGAESSVHVQLLTYKTTDREGRYFDALEGALRRAAARKVDVQLLVSDWCKRRWTVEGLQSLQALPNVTVKFVTLPQHSDGFIPFSRTIHSKVLVVDGARAWLGTGNWSRDYFHQSRNAGLLVDGAAFAGAVDAIFEELWSGEYAETVKPGWRYEAPRIRE